MSEATHTPGHPHGHYVMPHAPHEDVAPGDEHGRPLEGVIGYVIGLSLATLLTGISFWVALTHSLWGPSVPVWLAVLAVAQMGIHLVFFLHLTTGPDNTNNTLALAFGVVIVALVVGGSLWIMANLNDNNMPMMQRQEVTTMKQELMNLQDQH